MTIRELKEQIKDLDDDLLVYIQEDPEGNGYYHCNGIDGNAFVMKNKADEYRPDIYTEEDVIDCEDQEIPYDSFIRVAIIFP